MWLLYVVLPVGLLIPYAKIPAAVSLANGVALMAGVALIAFGLASETLGFVSSEPSSVAAKWTNLWGFWGNLLGCLWGGLGGAQDRPARSSARPPRGGAARPPQEPGPGQLRRRRHGAPPVCDHPPRGLSLELCGGGFPRASTCKSDRLRVGWLLSGRGTARAEDAQGTPTQSHISPSILVHEDKRPPQASPKLPPRIRTTHLYRGTSPIRKRPTP